MSAEIQHDDDNKRGAFFLEREGKRVAEQTYRHDGQRIIINHTFVDPSLRGEGVARKLLDALVAWARQGGTKVSATCPYAKAQFEKDTSLSDVYVARTKGSRSS